MLNATSLVTDARSALDEYTLSGKLKAFDADVEDTASSNFSTEDLENRILDGARYIAARCRASTMGDLIGTVNPTDLQHLHTESGGSTWPWMRLLGSRVLLNAYSAERRTFSGHMAGDGMAPVAARPVYIFEDFEFAINAGNGDQSSANDAALANVSVSVLKVPMFRVSDGSTTESTFDGIDWTGAKFVPLDSKFRAAIIYYVVSSCYQTLRVADLATKYRIQMMEELKPFLMARFSEENLPAVERV